MRASSDLLTVAEAADTLGVSPQRVHQLLTSEELDGPGLPAGRLRFPPNAERVSRSSLDALIARRAEKVPGGPTDGKSSAATSRVARAPAADRDVDRARAAAQELKVKLDAMRDQLRAERQRSRQLIGVASQLLDMLETQGTDADMLDDVSEGYSSALTQLLGPEAPS